MFLCLVSWDSGVAHKGQPGVEHKGQPGIAHKGQSGCCSCPRDVKVLENEVVMVTVRDRTFRPNQNAGIDNPSWGIRSIARQSSHGLRLTNENRTKHYEGNDRLQSQY